MGMFAKTGNVNYHLSFADQGKQTSSVHFTANKRKYSISVFRLQQMNRSYRFPLITFYVYKYIRKTATEVAMLLVLFSIYIYATVLQKKIKWKTKDLAIFLNSFTVCSSCKGKFVVCPFVDEEINRIYLFAKGLNGLAYLWMDMIVNPFYLSIQNAFLFSVLVWGLLYIKDAICNQIKNKNLRPDLVYLPGCDTGINLYLM